MTNPNSVLIKLVHHLRFFCFLLPIYLLNGVTYRGAMEIGESRGAMEIGKSFYQTRQTNSNRSGVVKDKKFAALTGNQLRRHFGWGRLGLVMKSSFSFGRIKNGEHIVLKKDDVQSLYLDVQNTVNPSTI
ncbi:hypothetical protein CIPAW_10G083400 [Carya illinoinensis]|uniref:Uncharacterized protein n=1 Tax=Carya illinoinensis TaxID=32201 RepID=A0A8T1PDG9_CARIL|nr:hypothetical protein CIPAW_10G083400 [Carya illinoinensis]